MKVQELFSSIRDTLQDGNKNYWDDSELLGYYNECVRYMAAERKENKTSAQLLLDSTKNTYNKDGILRYIRCKDSNGVERKLYQNDMTGEDDTNGVIIEDYNRVYVNNPEDGVTLIFTVVALPQAENITAEIRTGDELSFKYYILSKAYEKDADMENFQKSSYFYSKFLEAFRQLKNSSNVNYETGNQNIVKSYFF
jgi:hypothetical protein